MEINNDVVAPMDKPLVYVTILKMQLNFASKMTQKNIIYILGVIRRPTSNGVSHIETIINKKLSSFWRTSSSVIGQASTPRPIMGNAMTVAPIVQQIKFIFVYHLA